VDTQAVIAERSKKQRGLAGLLASPKGRELDLDVLRGVAILLAMGYHINQHCGVAVIDAILAPGRTIGWAGVDLFFVLSGFLVGRLVFREEAKTGRFDFLRFAGRRVFKLWPVLYTFLLAMMFFTKTPWSSYAWQIGVHVENFYPPVQATHLWSLAVEEHFYLVLGLLVPLYLARHSAWRLWPWLVSIMVLSLVLRLLGSVHGATPQDLQWQTQYRIDALSMGVLLALVSVQRPALLELVLKWRAAWAVITAAGVAFMVVFNKETWVGSTFGFTVSYLTAMSLLFVVYRSGIDRVARWPCQIIGFFGVYSYALYLWHVPVKGVAVPWLDGHLHLHNTVLDIVMAYALAIIVAFAVTRSVEWPMLWLRDRLLPARAHAV
jgi:peptidoglycan/LPS O-acetylase OafA/YrhL